MPGKPVGTVCFAWASAQGTSHSETRRLDGDRVRVRRAAVEVGITGLIELCSDA